MKFSCTFRRWFIEKRNLKNGWFVIWGHSLIWEFNTAHRIDFCSGIYGKMSHNMASVQFSHSVVSDSLWPHSLQHTRLPCPSPNPEPMQTHEHRVGDAIQPSHPLPSPSPPALKLSQHQGIFQWVSSSHQVAKVLKFQLQHQSFQWIFRIDFL